MMMPPTLAAGRAGMVGDVAILIILTLPAWLLAIRDSRWLVPYLICTWAFGPEVRRLNDWLGGAYKNVTLVSLIPPVATAALILPIMKSAVPLPPRLSRSLWLFVVPVIYGAALGIPFQTFGAVYEGLGLLLPVLFAVYAAKRAYVTEERDMWLRSLSTVAALVAVYGWYQFLVAPDWDILWLNESGMWSSSTGVTAGTLRVFSTLNSAGSLGLFMASALAVGLSNGRWRGPLGLLGPASIASCLLLSQVRLAWVMAAVAAATYVVMSRGQSRWKAAASIALVAGSVLFAQRLLPGGDLVSSRVDTFSDLERDGSVQGRVGQSIGALAYISAYPAGSGLGSTGTGGKLVSSYGGNGGADNGYVDLCITLGPVMLAMLMIGLVMLASHVTRFRRDPSAPKAAHTTLALAVLVSYLIGLLVFNILGGVGGAMLWLAVACPLGRQTRSLEGQPALAGDDAPDTARIFPPGRQRWPRPVRAGRIGAMVATPHAPPADQRRP